MSGSEGFLCFCLSDARVQLPWLWNAPGLCFRYAGNLSKRQLKQTWHHLLQRSVMVQSIRITVMKSFNNNTAVKLEQNLNIVIECGYQGNSTKKIESFSSKFYPQSQFVSGHVGRNFYRVSLKKPYQGKCDVWLLLARLLDGFDTNTRQAVTPDFQLGEKIWECGRKGPGSPVCNQLSGVVCWCWCQNCIVAPTRSNRQVTCYSLLYESVVLWACFF